MSEADIPVKGRLDEIEERIDNLIEEWTKTLITVAIHSC